MNKLKGFISGVDYTNMIENQTNRVILSSTEFIKNKFNRSPDSLYMYVCCVKGLILSLITIFDPFVQ